MSTLRSSVVAACAFVLASFFGVNLYVLFVIARSFLHRMRQA